MTRYLIVGASSGIAAETAVRLGTRGDTVGLVARRGDALERVAARVREAGGTAATWVADATDPEAVAAVVADAAARFGELDVIWANAGQGPDLPMATATVANVAAMTSLNHDVTVNVLVPAIARFRAQGHGHFVHTNSLAGLVAVPRQGPYGAAKAASKHLVDAARTELPFTFTSLYPGFVATERIAEDGLPKPFQIDVDEAVDHVLRGIDGRRADHAFPWPTATLVRGLRLCPRPLRSALLRRLAR